MRSRSRSAVPSWAWLTAIVTGSALVLAVEVRAVPFPTVLSDELIYAGAAKRLALGHGPAVPGGSYGYGLVYPLLLAPLYRLFARTDDAYAAIKLLNALAFSLTAVPAYLLARRVARAELALGAALLTVLLPASTYAPLVLTESVAFLVFLCLVVALVRVLEQPTVRRQLVALVLCGVAVETRWQFLVVVAALPVLIVVTEALERGGLRLIARRVATQYLATWIVLAVGAVAALAATVARGDGASSLLGPYSVLADSYGLGGIARWGLYHVAAYGLTLAVIPLIALPFGLASCLGRDAPRAHRAVGVATVVLVPAFLVQVAMFSSTEFGLGRMHERYLFYVAPLVLAVFVHWVDEGSPRARSRTAVVVATVIVALPLLLPGSGVGAPAVDAPVLSVLGYGDGGPFRLVAVLAVAFFALFVFAVRPARAWILIGVVAVGLAIVDLGVHAQLVSLSRHLETISAADVPGGPPDWVDRAVGRRARTEALFVTASPRCVDSAGDTVPPGSARFWRLAFFNHGIDGVIGVDPRLDLGVPIVPAEVARDGTVVTGGTRAAEGYVVLDDRLRLEGRQIARDPAARLTLWKPRLPLRITNLPRSRSVSDLLC